MKKFAAVAILAGASMFAGASAVSAGTGYNGEDVTATVSEPTPTGGTQFTVTVENCTPGSTATFQFNGGAAVDATVAADTTASAIATAPEAAGTYNGTVTCDGTTASFSVTVPDVDGTLPETGGGSSSTTTMGIAGLLLLAGVGMFGVSQMRRRDAERELVNN